MAKEPNERYQNATEVAIDLRRFLDGKPAKTRTLRRLSLAFSRSRPRLKIAALILSCAIAGLCVAFLANSFGGSRSDSQTQIRTARVSSEPKGAAVVFVPISDEGQPLTAKKVVASRVTPLDMQLSPGEYLVEASLGDGRFHQVVRQVPRFFQPSAGDNNSHLEKQSASETVRLADINIPSNQIDKSMILVSPTSDDNSPAVPFYIDANEVTVKEYLDIVGKLPLYLLKENLRPDQPIPLAYDDALRYAELAGKRLPSMSEWKAGQMVLPARTTADLAEWTSNSVVPPHYGDYAEKDGFRLQFACGADQRVILGETNSNKDYSADNSTAIYRTHFYPKVGIRCVRSAAPEFTSPVSDSSPAMASSDKH
jgi:hypothetical protein